MFLINISVCYSLHALHNWAKLGQTFAKVTYVLWKLQMCTAQGRGEQANRLLEGCVEA